MWMSISSVLRLWPSGPTPRRVSGSTVHVGARRRSRSPLLLSTPGARGVPALEERVERRGRSALLRDALARGEARGWIAVGPLRLPTLGHRGLLGDAAPGYGDRSVGCAAVVHVLRPSGARGRRHLPLCAVRGLPLWRRGGPVGGRGGHVPVDAGRLLLGGSGLVHVAVVLASLSPSSGSLTRPTSLWRPLSKRPLLNLVAHFIISLCLPFLCKCSRKRPFFFCFFCFFFLRQKRTQKCDADFLTEGGEL